MIATYTRNVAGICTSATDNAALDYTIAIAGGVNEIDLDRSHLCLRSVNDGTTLATDITIRGPTTIPVA